MQPYLVCAYADVTKKQADEGQEPELLNLDGRPMTIVMASDEGNAKVKAARLLEKDQPRLVVLARPF